MYRDTLASTSIDEGGESVSTADIRERVRERYAEAALSVGDAEECECGCGCGDAEAGGRDSALFGTGLYAADERASVPESAARASLGCGNPVAVADLHPGETVLDLGSGGGIDVLLSARRVGPAGKVYGLDMTDEMLALAEKNARAARATNVHFLKGYMEAIPLPAASVDVVISNCVVNLSPDKPQVLREVARVLRAGGRLGISDIVAEDRLSAEDRAERGSYTGCIAGALSESEYREGLAGAGLVDVEIVLTHEVADGIHGAIVRARKPEVLHGSEPADAASGRGSP
jgi:SAM-dependent methyltransferase